MSRREFPIHLHIGPNGSSARFYDPDCAAAARRRRRNLLLILALSGLSWLLIGALIVALT